MHMIEIGNEHYSVNRVNVQINQLKIKKTANNKGTPMQLKIGNRNSWPMGRSAMTLFLGGGCRWLRQCSHLCVFLNSFRSLEVNKYSVSMIKCIKPYLYKRHKNALIHPFNSADNNPPQAGSAYGILETMRDWQIIWSCGSCRPRSVVT